ncbi:MAG: hypothetical protein Q8936_06755 [Bacillota bacterium]|nr:hypothetical protein [Bacillota bacterium]
MLIEILLIIGIASAAETALFLFLKAKGVKSVTVVKEAETVASNLDNAAGVIKELVPNSYAAILAYIEKYKLFEKAINFAEQLFVSGRLPADQRKEKATDYVTNALKLIGTDITDNLQSYIDGGIEDIIYASKADDQIRAQLQKIVADLQKQLSMLQISHTELQNQNTQLNNKLTAIQNTVS